MAVSILTGKKWTGKGSAGSADIEEDIEVRTRRVTAKCCEPELFLYKHDNPNHRWVLVWALGCDGPVNEWRWRFEMKGWKWGHEVMVPENWRQENSGVQTASDEVVTGVTDESHSTDDGASG